MNLLYVYILWVFESKTTDVSPPRSELMLTSNFSVGKIQKRKRGNSLCSHKL